MSEEESHGQLPREGGRFGGKSGLNRDIPPPPPDHEGEVVGGRFGGKQFGGRPSRDRDIAPPAPPPPGDEEGRYQPQEIGADPAREKKEPVREFIRKVIKNWPTRVTLSRKMEELGERVREEREQPRDNPPENPPSQPPTQQ
jgi:hypothetical protein